MVYFSIWASKTLQKSSAIQKISVTLSSVIIAIIVCKLLIFSTLKLQQFSLITKFSDTYISSNSRYNTTLMEMYNAFKARWNAILQEPKMTDAWRRVEARKEKESASIYYGIMASAVKHNIGLDSKACIESAAKRFLSDMSWHGFTDFKQECVTNWTKLFATNEVQFTDNAIDNFLAFVDHMSCSADTYVSLGGSNGCADQLTNWDGTQKVGLGSVPQKKEKGLGR